MPLSPPNVTLVNDLPLDSSCSRAALAIRRSRQLGILAQISKRFRLNRNKGYQGIDLFLFLLCFIFCLFLEVENSPYML